MSESESHFGTVVFLGLPNAGKSSLLNAIVGQKIAPTTHKPHTTRRQLRGIVTRGNSQVVIVDTPGFSTGDTGLHGFMKQQIQSAMDDIDILVWVFDAQEDFAREEAFLRPILLRKKPVIAVVNKIDVFKNRNEVLPLIDRLPNKEDFAAIIPVSAHKKTGIDTLLKTLIEHLPVGEARFPADLMTDASEKDLAAELIREKAMLELQKELPYQIATQIEEFDETRRDGKTGKSGKSLVSISAVIFVERDSQKSIVIGQNGVRIKAIGTRARQDIEYLLGCQVMLKLFVKVEPDWRAKTASLKKVGYI